MTSNKKRTILIIPARGGSKRIPKKNIKKFIDRPAIEYAIAAAKASDCFDEIMVSTDDPEIAEISKSRGAKVPFLRSAKNSSDKASTISVLEEVLAQYKKLGHKFDLVCCLYPTAFFVTAEKLRNAKEMLIQSGADAVVPVARFSYPIQRSLKIKNGKLKMFWPQNYNKRTQDLEPAHHDCGQFYFLKTRAIFKQKKLFPKYTIPLETPELETQDIDNESDWKIAEMKYKLLNGKKNK